MRRAVVSIGLMCLDQAHVARAVELRCCSLLRELQLESNRISAPVLDLRPMQHTLQSLQVRGVAFRAFIPLLYCGALGARGLSGSCCIGGLLCGTTLCARPTVRMCCAACSCTATLWSTCRSCHTAHSCALCRWPTCASWRTQHTPGERRPHGCFNIRPRIYRETEVQKLATGGCSMPQMRRCEGCFNIRSGIHWDMKVQNRHRQARSGQLCMRSLWRGCASCTPVYVYLTDGRWRWARCRTWREGTSWGRCSN